jgi:hypothetical protein
VVLVDRKGFGFDTLLIYETGQMRQWPKRPHLRKEKSIAKAFSQDIQDLMCGQHYFPCESQEELERYTTIAWSRPDLTASEALYTAHKIGQEGGSGVG